MRTVLLVTMLLLAACANPEELARQDRETCVGYGFTPGTDAFANCLMKTAQARETNRTARAAAGAQMYNAAKQKPNY